MSAPVDQRTEQTLFTLATCTEGEERRDRNGLCEDLMVAVLEGFERGWIGHAELWRGDKGTHIGWRATHLGERELDAFMRRHRP